MATGRQRRGATALALLVALVVVLAQGSARASSDDDYPTFWVGSYDTDLGRATDIWFDAFDLEFGAAPERITFTTPAAYRTSPIKSVGTQIGEASVYVKPAGGGAEKTLDGHLVVTDVASFAADEDAQACAPGAHAATWRLMVKGGSTSLKLPVAVDRSGGGYRLTVCLASVGALRMKTNEVYFETTGVFRNPTHAGLFRFGAIVTPPAAGGGPDRTKAYELRADEPLPQTLTAEAKFDVTTKALTITGASRAAGHARSNINVHVYGGESTDGSRMKELGVAVTSGNGGYLFTKKIVAVAPKYVYAFVRHYTSRNCDLPAASPGGCAAESTDGTASYTAKVASNAPQVVPVIPKHK